MPSRTETMDLHSRSRCTNSAARAGGAHGGACMAARRVHVREGCARPGGRCAVCGYVRGCAVVCVRVYLAAGSVSVEMCLRWRAAVPCAARCPWLGRMTAGLQAGGVGAMMAGGGGHRAAAGGACVRSCAALRRLVDAGFTHYLRPFGWGSQAFSSDGLRPSPREVAGPKRTNWPSGRRPPPVEVAMHAAEAVRVSFCRRRVPLLGGRRAWKPGRR